MAAFFSLDWRLVLPSSFNPDDHLEGRLRRRADDARYLVSLIHWKLTTGRTDEHGRVPLMAKFLDRVMAADDRARVVAALVADGVIEKDCYIVGKKSFSYLLGPQFLADRHVRCDVEDARLQRALSRFQERLRIEQEGRMKPVHHHLRHLQYRLELDSPVARAILKSMPPERNPFDTQGVLLADLEAKRLRFSVGQYGRVSNAISSLARELRTALHHQGERLEHLDIRNSQPAILGHLVREANQQQPSRTERQQPIYDSENLFSEQSPEAGAIDRYCRLVQQGQFYDAMLMDFPSMARDTYKRRFLADVLAKRKANRRGDEYPSSVERRFRERFPPVYEFVRRVNNNGWEHANLIRELQRAESRLVIGMVSETLRLHHPETFFLTLHDAIFATPADLPKVEAAFEQAFRVTGYAMALSRST